MDNIVFTNDECASMSVHKRKRIKILRNQDKVTRERTGSLPFVRDTIMKREVFSQFFTN